jgi:hypothetical protein
MWQSSESALVSNQSYGISRLLHAALFSLSLFAQNDPHATRFPLILTPIPIATNYNSANLQNEKL